MKKLTHTIINIFALAGLAILVFLISVFHVRTTSGSKNLSDQTNSLRGQFSSNYALADASAPVAESASSTSAESGCECAGSSEGC